MKVLVLNGSPHLKGNTYHAIKALSNELEKENIDVEIITVGNKLVHGCIGCQRCFKEHNGTCPTFTDDIVNEIIPKIIECDGLVLASPTHYAGAAGVITTLLDRLLYVNGANGNYLRHKVGVAISVVRRSGGIQATDALNKYLEYSEMLIPTSSYWNVGYGLTPGEFDKDIEGNQIMRQLGKNMAWLLKLVENGKGVVKEPEAEPKQAYHFIRED